MACLPGLMVSRGRAPGRPERGPSINYYDTEYYI